MRLHQATLTLTLNGFAGPDLINTHKVIVMLTSCVKGQDDLQVPLDHAGT